MIEYGDLISFSNTLINGVAIAVAGTALIMCAIILAIEGYKAFKKAKRNAGSN